MRALIRHLACAAAIGSAPVLLPAAQTEPDEPAVTYRLALKQFDEGQYLEALRSFTVATRTDDSELAGRARKGKIRAALRIAEFESARDDAALLRSGTAVDAETHALHGDALWGMGLFDEAEAAYHDAQAVSTELSRARLGIGRALASRGRLHEGLQETLAARALSPRDPETHAVIGSIYEKLNRYEEASRSYEEYANLLPAPEATAMATARSRAQFLRSFDSRVPLATSEDDAGKPHTVPFKLIKNKAVLEGRINGSRVEFVLDTGAERTGISHAMATTIRARPVASTLTAGVGLGSWRRVSLARVDSIEIGSLRVRNVPVSIRTPALGGAPRWQGESLSPLALGFSVVVDYQKRQVTFARTLPEASGALRLPMRIHRLPVVRGLLNSKYPASFVVDTGGELISISAETANALDMRPARRIRLRVLGLEGPDESAFLLPGVDLDFQGIEYRKIGLAVLNLRAPSVLLGFQLGGIVGHKFLGGYRVSMDIERSELRLSQ